MESEVGKFLPAFCIGGIKPENLGSVLANGATRCVIVSHLLTAPDVFAETRLLKAQIQSSK